MLHPIDYSKQLNFVILAIAGALAFYLKEPLVFVISLILLNHSIGRFDDGDGGPMRGEPGEYDGVGGMGFTAPLER